MTRFTATTLDLSRLDSTALFDVLTFEGIRAARIADLKARLVAAGWEYNVESLESDPAIYLQESGAFRELLTDQAIRDAQLSVLLAFAQDQFLDRLGDIHATARAVVTPASADGAIPAVMEDDSRYRARIQLAPEAFPATGTPGGYIYHAMAASAAISDVGVAVLNRGTPNVSVELTVLPNTDSPDPSIFDSVRRAVYADNVKLLTDTISVRAAVAVPFSVSATLNILPGPDPAVVQAAATASLALAAARYRRLAGGFPQSALVAALQVPTVDSITLAAPSSGVMTQRWQYPSLQGSTLKVVTLNG